MQSIAKQEGGGQQGETGREELFKSLLKILNILDVMRDSSLLNVCMDSNDQQDHEAKHRCWTKQKIQSQHTEKRGHKVHSWQEALKEHKAHTKRAEMAEFIDGD